MTVLRALVAPHWGRCTSYDDRSRATFGHNPRGAGGEGSLDAAN